MSEFAERYLVRLRLSGALIECGALSLLADDDHEFSTHVISYGRTNMQHATLFIAFLGRSRSPM